MLKEIRNPDLYHGFKKKKDFFEGWYFKIVDASCSHMYAFIPGVLLSKDNHASHSFIQIIDGVCKENYYLKYQKELFGAAKDRFLISVADCSFSLYSMQILISTPSFSCFGRLEFKNIKRWPDSILNPGSMGFYNYLTFMQCYTQVCALDMEIEGVMNINGKAVDFSGGRGYIEKNWGESFPYSWVWIQCNNFSKSKASLTCSIGHIPFPLGSFRGFLIGVYIDDEFYSFTTIKRNKLQIERRGLDVIISVKNSRYILTVKTQTKPGGFIPCYGPRGNDMVVLLEETLCGVIDVELKELITGKVLFKDTGLCTGIEFGGEQMMIVDDDKMPQVSI